jgi:hypothetical protein
MPTPPASAIATAPRRRSIPEIGWAAPARSASPKKFSDWASYLKTLTILSSKSLALAEEGFGDEEAEDRDLIESYTPRFRR